MDLVGKSNFAQTGAGQTFDEWFESPIPPSWWYNEHATSLTYPWWDAIYNIESEAGMERG